MSSVLAEPARLSPALRQIVSEFRSVSPGTVYVRDRKFDADDRSRQRTVQRLQTLLYETYHSGRPAQPLTAAVPDLDFVDRLRESCRVPFTVDTGWRVVSMDEDNRFVVEKNGLRVWVDRARDVVGAQGTGLGSLVAIRIPPDRPNTSPGYFSVASGFFSIGTGSGRSHPDAPDPNKTVRFYCNLRSSAVCAFLERTTSSLESLNIKYVIKTLNRPENYGRRDGTVLYASRADGQAVGHVLRNVMRGLGDGVNPATPALALTLGPGLAYAHDPPQEGPRTLSFGQHRCRVLAEALWRAHRRRRTEPPQLASAVTRSLLAAGIDPARPYLNTDHGDENA